MIANHCASNLPKGSSTHRTPMMIPNAKSRKRQPARNPSGPRKSQSIRERKRCVINRTNRLQLHRSIRNQMREGVSLRHAWSALTRRFGLLSWRPGVLTFDTHDVTERTEDTATLAKQQG